MIKSRPKKAPTFFDIHVAEHADTFVAITLGKGTLLFCQVDNLTSIYSRYIIHRETIVNIEELPGYLMTVCLSHILIISKFNSEELTPLKRIDLRRPLQTLVALPPSKIMLGLANGDTEIFRVEESNLFRSCSRLAGTDTTLSSVIVEN